MKKTMIGAVLALSACGAPPGPSVPMQTGQNLESARAAVQACAPYAPKGGDDAVFGSYVGGVLLGGIVVGPIIVAANQDRIETNGEARAVDRCLAGKGFVRRDLTQAEVSALNRASASGRRALLDHLVGGGSLEGYRGM